MTTPPPLLFSSLAFALFVYQLRLCLQIYQIRKQTPLHNQKKKNPTSFTAIKDKQSHPTSTSSSSFSFTKKTQTDLENSLAPLRLHAKSSFVTRLDGLQVSLNLNTKTAALYVWQCSRSFPEDAVQCGWFCRAWVVFYFYFIKLGFRE